MHLLEILAAVGAVQGLLLLLLIIVRYRYHKNLPLALLVVALSLRLGTIPAWTPQTLLAHPWLIPVTTPLPFLFGFLLWWYARELNCEQDGTPPFVALHFVPWGVDTAVATVMIVGLSASGTYAEFVQNLFTDTPPAWIFTRNVLKVGANGVYMVAALYVAFHPRSRRPIPAARRVWLRTLVLVPLAALAAFTFIALHPGASVAVSTGVTLPFTIAAATLLAIIYMFSLLALFEPGVLACGCSGNDSPAISREEAAECERIATAARETLDRGAFRDPELSLQGMAEKLAVHPNRLSSAINHSFGESFPHLVNRYRLAYYLRRVREGASREASILELAFDAGFPSKSTFNRVFKAETGTTPSRYDAERDPHLTANPAERANPADRLDPQATHHPLTENPTSSVDRGDQPPHPATGRSKTRR